MAETLTEFAQLLLCVLIGIILVATLGLTAMIRSIRNIEIPPDADFFTTMHYLPLTLVILLDMLDLGLDIFAAPIAWIFLDRMGLHNLRNKAVIEAIIPFTQPIPTFTIAWVLARVMGLGLPPDHPDAAPSPRRRLSDRPDPATRSARIIDHDPGASHDDRNKKGDRE